MTALRHSLESQLTGASRAWLHEALAEAAAAAGAAAAGAGGSGAGASDASARAADASTGVTGFGARRTALPTWEARFAEAGRHCRARETGAAVPGGQAGGSAPAHGSSAISAPAPARTPDAASAARVLLLCAAQADRVTVHRLYAQGAAAERKAVLLALPYLEHVRDGSALPLVEDALRANDTRLIAAAVGPYASTHLDPHAWRHAVLKCLFTGVPVDAVHALAHRAGGDTELARMLTDYAAERTAAGRAVPADLHVVLALARTTQADPPAPETAPASDAGTASGPVPAPVPGAAPAPGPGTVSAPAPGPDALPEES
ncbi:EboA domain-containing protein [Streptomyces sp. NPDC091272]|uniref:EboA domain-containing protein n=1 Tax=Streptomyces sp. NPDC091272 TaxID=3365981 RepID=UPI0038153FBB